MDLDRAEGHCVAAALDRDLAARGGLETARQAAVVEVPRELHARVEGIERRAASREEKGVGVDRRGEPMLRSPRLPLSQERELREREEPVGVALRREVLAQQGERAVGIALEALSQAEPGQQLTRGRAGSARERALGQLALDDARILARDADR